MVCPFSLNDDAAHDGVCHPSYCPLALTDDGTSNLYCSFAVIAKSLATLADKDEQLSDWGDLLATEAFDVDADPDADEREEAEP
ncbi:hypothetical protein DWW58_00800 [Olsenella sp. AF16-14LB]|jgi:hypothetical protein|uniref:hypothetical protein n=1 Tax=unclassified Olsenella TaxID=2638792 RepID=UPI000E4A8D31|nr:MULTISPECIES: hypothetical protein [unclassified Olsenella]RGU52494.1 hypothetical protein DWW58_00800 [Olsenella sp. AF16-14LB]RGU83736.1 hypothetical protein DWW44_00800 [Olsenella sp. AF15-43LB]